MITIYKYFIPIQNEFRLILPMGAKILSFQTQNEKPALWVMLNTEADREERKFKLFWTGHPIQLTGEFHFIGTVQQSQNPPLVWHLFEEK